MVVRDVEREDIEFISKTLGCLPISHIDHFKPEKLSTAELVEEVEVRRGWGWGCGCGCSWGFGCGWGCWGQGCCPRAAGATAAADWGPSVLALAVGGGLDQCPAAQPQLPSLHASPAAHPHRTPAAHPPPARRWARGAWSR
jgi:hypothetical protein